ncbi:multidrug effflux MFS transporter [Planosporangium mesophilum]|uniref:Bcr/CflA family drug resistance efflux transporter n=1 Tax=Planosporangium mesophilum TaxID=689768 RepID=A0A8J3T8H5_9ACTN|nr:multidrug effflux MFS transporter [Planosporangium mesophilum]NJC83057.1 multidrug effflux MFS transporter [Planosporangium mesophilum]GII22465.1 Bcr/CflA family drug resistance efflux transporter [Planosporangium mesophilum]
MTTETTQTRVRRPGVLLVLLGTVTGIGPFSMDMYLPALPHIGDEFHAGPSGVQLTLTACLVGLAVGQLLIGPLSDRWGRRRPVLAGLGLYAVTSLLCAVAPSVGALTAARLGQGVAGGAALVIVRAVVRDLYSGAAAAAYFSRLMLIFGVAPVVAPSLGGLALRVTGWRGIFVILAAIGALVLAAAVVGLPETLPPERRYAGGLAQTLRGMRALLRDRGYVGYVLALGLGGAGLFAYIAGSSYALQRVYGASPQLYGLLFGLNALGFVFVGQLNGRLVRRVPPRRLLAIGLAVLVGAAVAFLLVTRWHQLAAAAVPLFVFMSVFGLVFPNTTALALDLHPERAGAASALLGAGQSLCGAIIAPLVGLAGAGSATPMALAMTVSAVGGGLAFLTVAGRAYRDPARRETVAPK